MSTFPSTLTSYTNPQSTDKLNNPSHSAIETAQNSGLTQVEAVIGTSSSIIGTIIGDLRNPTSNGGGHVQTAVLGGTGQTTFVKGNLLVAQSGSVLSKLAVGINGQILVADSTQSAGVKWGNIIASVGGTGQVSYSKGDLLVAINSSTLSKLAVAVDGKTLRCNSSTLTGLEWQ